MPLLVLVVVAVDSPVSSPVYIPALFIVCP